MTPIVTMPEAPPRSKSAPSLQHKLLQLVAELDSLFLERTEPIKLLLTAYLAKTNVFLGGPPGTGKTMMAKAITHAFSARSFYYLMTATTQVDEILGAVDLSALQASEFRRDLSNKLADVELAILDEVFKANSPCLNTLLGLILDHQVENGKQVHLCPLISLVGCSNELPQEESLAPFWDRFALRYWVEDVSRKHKRILMQRAASLQPTPAITAQFTLADLEQMQAEVQALPLGDGVIDAMLDISSRLAGDGITASTRKHVQMIDLIRCYTYVCGAEEVGEDHLSVLKHVFWNQVQERGTVVKVIAEVINAPYEQLNGILNEAKRVVDRLRDLDPSDAARYKAFLGGADSKLTEMLQELSRELKRAPKDSGKHKLAKKVHGHVTKLRNERILNAMAQIEFGI